MTTSKKFLAAFAVLAVGAAACQTGGGGKKESSAEPQEGPSWQYRMQALSHHLKALAPAIYSREEYAEKNNFEKISGELSGLAQTVNDLKNHAAVEENDPSVKVTLQRMRADLNQAVEAYRERDFEFSRSLVKGSLSHCFYCHTRMAEGLQIGWEASGLDLKSLTSLERADYLVATRQFDRAQKGLEEFVLGESKDDAPAFEKEKALKKYIALAVRVNRSPVQAREFISRYLAQSDPAPYLKETLKRWEEDLAEWIAEKNGGSVSLKKSVDLLEAAKKRQNYAFDSSSDILFLRGSEGLHELLKADPKVDKATVYYHLGRSYSVLRGLGLWNLDEIYYESCIRATGSRGLAGKCYKALEDSILIGYSGSAGVFVPYSVRRWLESLKKEAAAKKMK